MSDLLRKKEQFTHLLIFHERPEQIAHSSSFVMSDLSNWLTIARPERFAHSCSFVLSDLSESLTVAHMIWAIWANDRMSNKWMSKFPTLRIGEDFEEKSFLSLAKHVWIRIRISLKSGIRILVKTFWIFHSVLKRQSGEILLGWIAHFLSLDSESDVQ